MLFRSGVEEDDREAARWFAEAARRGSARAQMLLGECYENGYGVEKDEHRAVELYRQSHEGGHASGTCALGGCYENGTGVRKDLKKAEALYRQAAERGYQRAEEALKRLRGKKRLRWPWQK